ncbi:reverse transcriptase domain, reverse transcriptase zinc-binding domain protein [Tanacetum coccineum]
MLWEKVTKRRRGLINGMMKVPLILLLLVVIYIWGFTSNSKVQDLIRYSQWTWPIEWNNKYQVLNSFISLVLNDVKDKLWWKDMEGNLLKFYVAQAYQAIRPRAPEVEWFVIVWFLQCIPLHAFLVWLLIGEKLKTKDKIRAWEVADSVSLEDMKCPLCNLIRDSHSHLFFKCGISLQVWQRVKVLFHIPDIRNS